jgi:hypothetical protein
VRHRPRQALAVDAHIDLLIIAADGYGKRTPVSGIHLTGRATASASRRSPARS